MLVAEVEEIRSCRQRSHSHATSHPGLVDTATPVAVMSRHYVVYL